MRDLFLLFPGIRPFSGSFFLCRRRGVDVRNLCGFRRRFCPRGGRKVVKVEGFHRDAEEGGDLRDQGDIRHRTAGLPFADRLDGDTEPVSQSFLADPHLFAQRADIFV